LIVGAGLSGLSAARRLSSAGLNPAVIEKESKPGGRLASAALSGGVGGDPQMAVFDTGAQFFTVRDARFQEIVDQWLAEGRVVEWSRGFAAADGSYFADGHPRYRGRPDMAALSASLAQDVDLYLDMKVESIELEDGSWGVYLSEDMRLKTPALILTAPVPISSGLLPPALLEGIEAALGMVGGITYDPCLALLVLLDSPGAVPYPGGLWPGVDKIDWIADNFQKGVTQVSGSITIHASADFSRRLWDADDETIIEEMLHASAPWLRAKVISKKLIRWPYSKPVWTYPDPFWAADLEAPLIFAGDAFAGPRVEGAVLSGLAAADYLLSDPGFEG